MVLIEAEITFVGKLLHRLVWSISGLLKTILHTKGGNSSFVILQQYALMVQLQNMKALIQQIKS